MDSNFDRCVRLVLKSEGGYVDHPKDPGGATNLGVTKTTWESWVGHEVTKDDIKVLTIDDVMPVYKSLYWDRVKGDDLPQGIDYVVFDIAVNSGVSRASRMLQQCVGADVDGKIGNKTLQAVILTCNVSGEKYLINKLCDKRMDFWKSLPTFDTFGRGWTNRGDHVRKEALEMVG
jgi:lysozyme family protein